MAIKWLCTGKSEHGYQYKDAEGTIQNEKVIAIDFKAEIDTESVAGSVNELFDTKPVLTEAGVTAFIGLQVYPQGFTVYFDTRLTTPAPAQVVVMGAVGSTYAQLNTSVGEYLATSASSGGDIT